MWEVLETARYVTKKSSHVRIDKQALSHFSRKMREQPIDVPPWDSFHHFYDGSEETVSYLLVLDSLNFCFWPPKGSSKWEIEYKSRKVSGYHALAASLKQAIESGIPVTKPQYLAHLSLDELKKILNGHGALQLLKERLRTLHELGDALLGEFSGQAYRLVEAAQGSAVKLSLLLAEKMPSFRDYAEYHGRKTFFYKRAQIFAADLHGAFEGKKWGNFKDIAKLTAFADYKLPQVLRHLGILHYSKPLDQKVDQRVYLKAGCPEEIEIRANTIWAVELIRQELERTGKQLRPFEIDWILWNKGQEEDFKDKPYHRTLTIFY